MRCSVAVHALRVRGLKTHFPEAGQRRRVWFAAQAAADLVAEPELQSLLRHIDLNPGVLRRHG